jgi:general secretion pathway protein J
MRAGPRASGGFALIEALASLVIVGMIGLMLFSGIGTGARVWERIDTREAGREAVDSAQSTLRDRIEQIYPATLYDKTPPYIDFAGQANHLVFISSPPEAGRPAPLRRYGLLLNTAGQMILTSVSDAAPQTDTVVNQVILSGVRGLEVAYFGSTRPDFTRRWRPDWNDETALPSAVRIRVAFEPGDRRTWPDLIVHPRTTTDVSCSLDPISHGCKGRL